MFQAVEITSVALCVASIINELKFSSYIISLVMLKRGNIKKVLQVNTSLSQNVLSQYSIHNRDQSQKNLPQSQFNSWKTYFQQTIHYQKVFCNNQNVANCIFYSYCSVFNFNDPTTWLKATNLKKKIMETVIKCLSNLKPKLKIYIYWLFFT